MMSRLSFAVAMKVSPDVMLLDELLAVGDESFRAKAYAATREKMRLIRQQYLYHTTSMKF